jgi:diaminohydroxyphosphoribosylaminopyrimidine deaminase/5-amino-6-(5-phosphoribosylamino)uracil reductase
MVGALLLRDGDVVSEGFHQEYGGPHAEVAALGQCGDPAGATCVVSLEPCNHHGKTPPCVDALIDAGVARVVVAIRDPGRIARGGVERLRQAGIQVDVGVLEKDAAVQNAAFLWSTVRTERPFVALKVASSIDGFIADSAGRSQWISGPEARAWAQWLRAGQDGIGVGRRTVVRDDPQLTVRGAIAPRIPPTRVVFTRTGELPEHAKVLRAAEGTPTIVVAHPDHLDGTAGRLEAHPGVTIVEATEPEEALRALRELGLRSLLIEGGGALAGSLLARDLIDRVYWIQAPIWLGRGTPAFGDRPASSLVDAPRWRVTGRKALGEDSLIVIDRELCLQG